MTHLYLSLKMDCLRRRWPPDLGSSLRAQTLWQGVSPTAALRGPGHLWAKRRARFESVYLAQQARHEEIALGVRQGSGQVSLGECPGATEAWCGTA